MARKIKVDFKDVSDGFINITKPGNYPAKLVKVEPKKSGENKPYLNWELEVISGNSKGAKLWYVTSLQPQALFNLRNLLIAAGLDVPKKVISIDLDAVIGRVVEAKVVMEEYNGEERPKIKSLQAIADLEDDEDEDDDYEDDSDDSEDDLEEFDIDDDDDEDDEEEEIEEEPAPKKKGKKTKEEKPAKKGKSKKKVEVEDDEDDEEEEY